MPDFPFENMGERHIPVVLLLDTSGSMANTPIAELNQGLLEFQRALQEDKLAYGRTEICLITFNSSVQTEVEFCPASRYEPPTLVASGLTAMNEAIDIGLAAIEDRISRYKELGITYYRPWMFLLTDGAPTDEDREVEAKAKLHTAIENGKVVYIPMAIGENADRAKLQEYYPASATVKPVLAARANNFKEAFVWLSRSVSLVTNSDPAVTQQVRLAEMPSTLTIPIC